LKSSTKIFDDIPELELTCQEEMLTETQLQNYPSQVNISKFLFLKYILIVF
jgi:penicillin V acylase-like amidase (Ntn superfamily)